MALQIPARLTTAIVGPSGGGKTTLADLVLGLLRPESGEVLIDGKPLVALDLREWRHGIGYVPQESFLFNDTIRANLSWDGVVSDEGAIRQALGDGGIATFVAELPDGLDTVVGERGVRLSGGERQRLALARALIRRPQLLVLDEATSALDYENERLIRMALEELRGKTTILLITHRLPLVRHADLIHVIEDGGLVESGSWEELAESGGRFRSLMDAAGGERSPRDGH